MNIEKAQTISSVAQTIVNTAKVEVDFLKATNGASGSGFITDGERAKPRLVKS